MDKPSVLAHRLERNGLGGKMRGEGEYLKLFRRLQPVAPIYFSYPGSAPRLVHRTLGSDEELAEGLRGERLAVKGRFWGGQVGYVVAEELALYAAAFCKPIQRFTPEQEQILEILRHGEGMSTQQVRQESGLKHKKLMPVIHRLQRAFLLYEDQEDNEWDRPWSLFENAWPDVDLGRYQWDEAAAIVLGRFLHSHVFATFGQIRAWSQFALRDLKKVLAAMETNGVVFSHQVEGVGEGFSLVEDRDLPKAKPPAAVYMLHKADPLVRPHLAELKERFAGRETLQYLLIDGELAGAVCGHWRIGPHDVDDIAVDLPKRQIEGRQTELIDAVSAEYHPPHSQVLRCGGKALSK